MEISRNTTARRGDSTTPNPTISDRRGASRWKEDLIIMTEVHLRDIGLQLNKWGIMEEYNGYDKLFHPIIFESFVPFK